MGDLYVCGFHYEVLNLGAEKMAYSCIFGSRVMADSQDVGL